MEKSPVATVLIADDHPMFRAALRQAVREALADPFCVEACDDCSLRVAAEEHPKADLVLLDLLMPGSRGFKSLAPLLDRLRFRGVRVVGVLDGFDGDSPQARMQAGLSGLMSDELRAGIRVRTHSALQMRATNGRPTGGKVYGAPVL